MSSSAEAGGGADRAFENVRFEFLTYGSSNELTGSVRVRGAFMILDIPENTELGQGPYLLKGEKSEQGYGSPNHARNAPKADVRWAAIGPRQFVGVWVEEGTDYFFRFEVPDE